MTADLTIGDGNPPSPPELPPMPEPPCTQRYIWEKFNFYMPIQTSHSGTMEAEVNDADSSHILGEQHCFADKLANGGEKGAEAIHIHSNYKAHHWKYMAGFGDGALKGDNKHGGCGMWIAGSNELVHGRPNWKKVASWRRCLDEGYSAIKCEFSVAFVMVYAMKHLVLGNDDLSIFPRNMLDLRCDNDNFRR